jgi:hypothetical protein
MTAFRGNDGPRIAIEKLLPERILELVDHARYLRGRYPLPPRHDGKFCASYTSIKISSARMLMLLASTINAYPAKVFPALWHFSHCTTRNLLRLKTEEEECSWF